jgi:hypothetical protein
MQILLGCAMGTNVVRDKRRAQILLMLSIAFAVMFLASFVSQAVELARLESWRVQLEDEITDLERQRAELDAQIALRETDAWISQAAVEAGMLPPNAYAVQALAEAPAQPQAEAQRFGPAADKPPRLNLLTGATSDNTNWLAWRRLLTGRP